MIMNKMKNKLFKIKDYTISSDPRQYIITGDGITKYKSTIEEALDRIADEYDKQADVKDIEEYIKQMKDIRNEFKKEIRAIMGRKFRRR